MMQYDGDLDIPEALPGEPPAIRAADGPDTLHGGHRLAARDLRDPEVRARDVLLERQPQRDVR